MTEKYRMLADFSLANVKLKIFDAVWPLALMLIAAALFGWMSRR